MGNVVFKVGDDVSTDIVYPGRFMATVLPDETPEYAFADSLEFNRKLNAGEIPEGSFIVAGQNFGCGSSREQAASCLKGWNVYVVAKHFARIFMQNSINLGLQLIICPDVEADEGDTLEIKGDKLVNVTKGKEFDIVPLPKAQQAIIDAGGLIPYTRARMLQEQGA